MQKKLPQSNKAAAAHPKYQQKQILFKAVFLLLVLLLTVLLVLEIVIVFVLLIVPVVVLLIAKVIFIIVLIVHSILISPQIDFLPVISAVSPAYLVLLKRFCIFRKSA